MIRSLPLLVVACFVCVITTRVLSNWQCAFVCQLATMEEELAAAQEIVPLYEKAQAVLLEATDALAAIEESSSKEIAKGLADLDAATAKAEKNAAKAAAALQGSEDLVSGLQRQLAEQQITLTDEKTGEIKKLEAKGTKTKTNLEGQVLHYQGKVKELQVRPRVHVQSLCRLESLI